MGQGNSEEWKGYQHQLFADKTERGIWVDGTEEKGATKVLRHPRSKDGLQGFLKDEEKNELDTAWKLFAFSGCFYKLNTIILRTLLVDLHKYPCNLYIN